MKLTVSREFTLPEEKYEADVALYAEAALIVLNRVLQWLRSEQDGKTSVSIHRVIEMIYDEAAEEGLPTELIE